MVGTSNQSVPEMAIEILMGPCSGLGMLNTRASKALEQAPWSSLIFPSKAPYFPHFIVIYSGLMGFHGSL